MKRAVLLALVLGGALLIVLFARRDRTSLAPPVVAKDQRSSGTDLYGGASYTPYDAHAMLWSKQSSKHKIVWTASGAASGQLLMSQAGTGDRPDWVLCTQGVVAGLAARGLDPVVIASVYVSGDAIRPVLRIPKGDLHGSRSLFIARSSIEFAFDEFLKREGLSRADIRIPAVEKAGFDTITSLLSKPKEDQGAIDFGILVDPFITNLLNEQPDAYQIGEGGLYTMHYCVVVRRGDLEAKRGQFEDLLREMLAIDSRIESMTEKEFYDEVWGRTKNDEPERLPRMKTFSQKPLHLAIQVHNLRKALEDEITYLADKYPNDLKRPANMAALVDETLLLKVAAERVAQ